MANGPSLPRRLPQHRQPLLRRHFLQLLHQSRARGGHRRVLILRQHLHQAHHRQRDRGRGHHLLRQHGSDLRGGLADGGMAVNLRMLRRMDQGEKVEAADGAVGSSVLGAALLGSVEGLLSFGILGIELQGFLGCLQRTDEILLLH